MNIFEKYLIINHLHGSRANPTLSNDIYADTYTLKTNLYNIHLDIRHPSFDGEKPSTILTINNKHNQQSVEPQRDTAFARLVALIIKRKYYNSSKTKTK